MIVTSSSYVVKPSTECNGYRSWLERNVNYFNVKIGFCASFTFNLRIVIISVQFLKGGLPALWAGAVCLGASPAAKKL